MSVAREIAKAKLRSFILKKVYVALGGIIGPLLLVLLIAVSLVGSSILIKEAYENFFGGIVESVVDYFKGTDSNMRKLMDEIGEDVLDSFPMEEDVINEIIASESNSIIADRTIKVEETIVTEERHYIEKDTYYPGDYYDGSIEDDTITVEVDESHDSYDVVTVKRTSTRMIDYVQEYYDASYKYRVPWQLVYGLSFLSAMYSDDSLDLEQVIADMEDNTNEDKYIEVDIDVVKEIATILSPDMTVLNGEFKAGANYSREDIRTMSDHYGSEYSIETTTQELEDKTIETTISKYIYRPQIVIETVNSYYTESEHEYERMVTSRSNGQMIEVINTSSRSKVNYTKLAEALVLVGGQPQDAELLIPIIEGLPGGENLLLTLEPIIYEFNADASGHAFDGNIPTIIGTWTRQDLLNVAKSLQNQVHYFFGDKYLGYGANPKWGVELKLQTISGSGRKGQYGYTGLDCSGYVDWVYYQMTGVQMSIGDKGSGSANLWQNSKLILEENLKPGDIGFYQYGGGKHVGIYIGKIDGVNAFIHAGGSTWGDDDFPWGQVIVTKNYEYYNTVAPSKFEFFRRLPVEFLEVGED